jgi:thiamine pyrophosphate-dependent acetolactate synthase large subunit-like protein
MTPQMAPVVLVADGQLQEDGIRDRSALSIPKLTLPTPPQGDTAAVAELARLLVAADNPVLVADRLARTPAAMPLLVELAETLQAAVIDKGGRMNFPSRHPLNQTERASAVIAEADLVVGLEVLDFWGTVNALRDQQQRTIRPLTKPGTRLVTITTGELYIRSNYQDFRRLPEVDLAIAADGEATLPSLIESVKRLVTGDRRRAFAERGARLADARDATFERARQAAAYAGMRAPSAPRACARSSGRRSRTRTGRWCPATTATGAAGRDGCGISPSPTTGSATPAEAASATAPRHRWAPPSPTGGTDGCRSRFKRTAT